MTSPSGKASRGGEVNTQQSMLTERLKRLQSRTRKAKDKWREARREECEAATILKEFLLAQRETQQSGQQIERSRLKSSSLPPSSN